VPPELPVFFIIHYRELQKISVFKATLVAVFLPVITMKIMCSGRDSFRRKCENPEKRW
jgi:hypothetical protein